MSERKRSFYAVIPFILNPGVGIVQGLLTTRKLHGVHPYDYLVDVLQRVGQHPASKVHELTPRLWKQHFAALSLRSVLHNA